jgi:DNA-binding protein HU-beta
VVSLSRKEERMNKGELVELVAQKAKLPSKAAARRAVETALRAIMEAVARGDSVTLARFGTFRATLRKAGRRFNPRTRQPMDVPAKRVPKFKAGKGFKQIVARG